MNIEYNVLFCTGLALAMYACGDVSDPESSPDASEEPATEPDAGTVVVQPPDGCPIYYLDNDGDGFGRDELWVESCEVSMTGWTRVPGDCDDDHAGINPGAAEIWYDGTDQNCDGRSDFDADLDGLEHHALTGGRDCKDDDPSAYECGVSQEQAARTCLSLHEAEPDLASGVYWIDPDGDGDTGDAWQGWCDMERDGGGWTLVLQNNGDVGPGPNLSWVEATQEITVRAGVFGSELGDFDLLVGLAEWSQIGTEARVEVGPKVGVAVHQALYELILDDDNAYALSMANEQIRLGSTSSGLYEYHAAHSYRLTTYDVDHDFNSGNCASRYGHPWWYGSCWSGSFRGSDVTGQKAFWTGSSVGLDWGAIWLR